MTGFVLQGHILNRFAVLISDFWRSRDTGVMMLEIQL